MVRYTLGYMWLFTVVLMQRMRCVKGMPRQSIDKWSRWYYSESEAYSDRMSSKWGYKWASGFASYVQVVLQRCPPRGFVLDVGCVGAQSTHLLVNVGRKAVGVDLSLRESDDARYIAGLIHEVISDPKRASAVGNRAYETVYRYDVRFAAKVFIEAINDVTCTMPGSQ